MLADDLVRTDICQWNGIIYAAGWADGCVWFEYCDSSDFRKASIDGTQYRVKICDAEEQQPAIEVTPSGEIIVAVSTGDGTETFYSLDQGRTWSRTV